MNYYNEDEEIAVVNVVNPVGYGISYKEPLKSDGTVNIITGRERINQAIGEVLLTRIGSRLFQSKFGSRLPELEYEQNDFIAKDMSVVYTEEALKDWEPRISVVSIEAEISKEVLSIDIVYKIKDTGEVGAYTYTLDRSVPGMG